MSVNGYNEYWETDEFEDLVARSLIGLHETKVKKTKKTPKCIRFDENTFKRFKNIGCYFTPNDRVGCINHDDNNIASFIQQIDVINDGIPDRVTLTLKTDPGDLGYLSAFYLERLPFLPKPYSSDLKGKYFRMTQLFFKNNYVCGDASIIVIDKEGYIQSCYIQDHYIDPITKRPIHIKNRPIIDNNTGTYKDYHTIWGSMAIQLYQDRRYLWNVQAHEGGAKTTFGVYPEQIKSLFYARELPQTEFGRKKPILHWVAAHQRRMKSGTEFDVEKYLRGTHEFIMHGTKFKITNPVKHQR